MTESFSRGVVARCRPCGGSEDIFDKQDFRQGEEHARPDRRSFAGMLFINDEGTENGALIQTGTVTADGRIDSGLSLTDPGAKE